MKNILFFRISLALVGLLCSGGQANYIFPISGEEKNIPNFTALYKFGSQPMRPMLFDLYTQLFKTMGELFDSLAELNTDIVKRNANSNQIPRLVFISSAHTWNIYFIIKKQYNKIVNKLYTVYTTLIKHSFMASIVPGIRKYWLLKGISADTIAEDVLLYVTLVVFCGMLLFVALITIKAIRQLWNSRHKLKPQKEDLLLYV
eukprot:XP_016659917.1 PREDICTED: uncharacterized protein LOC100574976 isoform X2 [Acyrthosiphon pisum]